MDAAAALPPLHPFISLPSTLGSVRAIHGGLQRWIGLTHIVCFTWSEKRGHAWAMGMHQAARTYLWTGVWTAFRKRVCSLSVST